MYLFIKEFARKDYANLSEAGKKKLAEERSRIATILADAKRKVNGISQVDLLGSGAATRRIRKYVFNDLYDPILKAGQKLSKEARQKILDEEAKKLPELVERGEEVAKKVEEGVAKKGGKVADFIKNHKKALGITGASALAVGGGYLAYRHYKNKKKK